MNKMATISKHNFGAFLDTLKKDYNVYVPIKKKGQRFYKRYDGLTDDVVIGEVRPFEPLKIFFSRSRERLAVGFRPEVPHDADKPIAIVGVKACDLKGFKIQDHVFQDHDYQDPLYIKNRRENLIISADCTCVIDTCFCLALGIKPYPREDFDLNLSQAGDGFVVEAGSEKGKALMEKNASLLEKSTEEQDKAKEKQRASVVRDVEVNIKKYNIPDQGLFEGIVDRNFAAPVWTDEVKTCVECGACTIICPTCHCFLIYDQMDKEQMARLRVWDSCMLKGYARVGGGANPRSKLWMRLRNRFEKKFDFFPKVCGVYACTGCGRCVSACPAKIDIRKVLRRLVNNE